jgi:hypothetical protein
VGGAVLEGSTSSKPLSAAFSLPSRVSSSALSASSGARQTRTYTTESQSATLKVGPFDVVPILRERSYNRDARDLLKLAVYVDERKASIETGCRFFEREMWTLAAKVIAEKTQDVGLMLKAAELHYEAVDNAESSFERSIQGGVHSSFLSDALDFAKRHGSDEDVESVWKLVDPIASETFMLHLGNERAGILVSEGNLDLAEGAIKNLDMVVAEKAQKKLEKKTGFTRALAEHAAQPENLDALASNPSLFHNVRAVLDFAKKTAFPIEPSTLDSARKEMSQLSVSLPPMPPLVYAEALNMPRYVRRARNDYDGDFCARPTGGAFIDRAEEQLKHTPPGKLVPTRIDTSKGKREVKGIEERKLIMAALVAMHSVEAQWPRNSTAERAVHLEKVHEHFDTVKDDLDKVEIIWVKDGVKEAEERLSADTKAVSSPSPPERV